MRTVIAGVALLVMVVGLHAPALAFTLDYDFEDLANGETVAEQYAADGVHFGAGVLAVDPAGPSYPPHSGDIALQTVSTQPYLDVTFDTPANYVEAWYTSYYGLSLEAYDSSNDLISSVWGAANLADSCQLSVGGSGSEIAWVRFHDSGNLYIVDDLHIEGPDPDDAVPEPCTWVLLSATGIAGVIARRRRLA